MNFKLENARQIAMLLADVAQAEIMPRFNNLSDAAVRTKSSAFDLVTDADEAAEHVISDALRRLFPGAVVVGEEAAASDPSLLNSFANAELAFLVDPIDGTANFAAGLPLFGVMVAAMVRSEIVAGVIHDPVGRSSAIAVRGQGAWLEKEAGQPKALRVAAPVEPAAMLGIVGISYLPQPLRTVVARNSARLAATACYRCAAHEYRMAAAGHCHLLMYNKLMPWDHAAGWLLHQEAGGYSAHFDGQPYRTDRLGGGLLCAPDEQSWRAARATLLGEE